MNRLYPDHPILGVGAVITRENKILLEKRKNEPGRGKWSIPGGLVEVGEKIEQTAIREVKEETGLEVYDPTLIDIVNTISTDAKGRIKYHFVVVDFHVKVQGGSLEAASDADELRWIPFNEVEGYILTKSFRFFFVKNRRKIEDSNSYP